MTEKNSEDEVHKEWKDIPIEDYEEVGKRLVHFSTKLRNTVAAAAGVRCSESSALRIPYVSVRSTIGAREVPLDYAFEVGKSAKPLKQAEWAEMHDERAGHLSDSERTEIVAALHRHAGSDEVFEGAGISPRMAQLLLPMANGEYMAVTPIASGGLAQLIYTEGVRHNEERKENPEGKRYVRRGVTTLGGSKPQNAGRRAYPASRPLYCSTPQPSIAMLEAAGLLRNGLAWRLATARITGLLYKFTGQSRSLGGEERTKWLTKRLAPLVAGTIIGMLRRRRQAVSSAVQQGIKTPLSPEVSDVHAAALGLYQLRPSISPHWHSACVNEALDHLRAIKLPRKDDSVMAPGFTQADIKDLHGEVVHRLQEALPR